MGYVYEVYNGNSLYNMASKAILLSNTQEIMYYIFITIRLNSFDLIVVVIQKYI